jgi:hypothetical protein
MIPSKPLESVAASEGSLEPFFARIAASNPFTDNRSSGPTAGDIDVANLHAKQFERLVALTHEAHAERRGLGTVLWGEAGIGKSHLLARFARWAEQDLHACLVYLHNLQARPAHLPRSLLKSVVSILTRGQVKRFRATTLYRLANALMGEALQYDPDRTYTWADLQSSYGSLIDRLGAAEPWRAALVDRTVYDVILSFFRSAYLAEEDLDDGTVARLAVRWLSGDALDPSEARHLGLPPSGSPDEPVALADDERIKHVLLALFRMAASREQPFILCFDQVDNLDMDQAAALARFLAALLDSSANLLLVTSGIQATLLRWRDQKVIQDSAWDRLAQFEIALQRMSVAEGQEIVAARLRHFLEPAANCPAIQSHLQHDRLFPLGQSWAGEFLKNKIEVRPRDVLSWAREGWRREQAALKERGGPAWLARWGSGGPAEPATPSWTSDQIEPAIDIQVAEKFAQHKTQRHAAPHMLPPNASELAGLVAALLEHSVPSELAEGGLRVEQMAAPRKGKRPAYDLLVHHRAGAGGGEARSGVLFLATGSANAATAALGRLVQDTDPPQRVFLITDERMPLPLGPIGKEYYEELCQRGADRFRHLELTFAQYAELDALQATVGLARSGDLEIELPGGWSRAISPEEVVSSQRRQRRYVAAPVLKELLTDPSETSSGLRAELKTAAT